jgi:hypothetical protein
LGRDVALKIRPPEMANNPARNQRFEQEARAIAALDHRKKLSANSWAHRTVWDKLTDKERRHSWILS